MKQKKRKYDDPNCIEETARELFGYDDASLNAEMNEAERAWAAEKAANPEAAAKAQRDADEGFDKLMANIRKKGIQPVSEEEYEEEEKKNNQKTKRLGRKGKKVLVLAAVVCVMGLGTTMVVSARRELKYRTYPMQGEKNIVVRRSDTLVAKVGKTEEAYIEIENTLGIKALTLGHVPKGMLFKQLIVHEDHAIIEWDLNGKSIYFKESKVPIESGFTGAMISDRKTCEEVYNTWIGKKIEIEANIVDGELIEYSADIDIGDFYYYLSGMVEQDEFVELVNGICYK